MKKVVLPDLSPEALAQVVPEPTPVVEPVAEETVPTVIEEPVVDVAAQLSEEITKLKTDLAATAELLAAKDQEIANAMASADGLKNIVVAQITKMRVALSLAAVDMSSWDAEAVATEYVSVAGSFAKFPVGSVVTKTEEVESKAVQSSLDESAYRSLGFGIKK